MSATMHQYLPTDLVATPAVCEQILPAGFLASIYAATLHPDCWQRVMQLLSSLFQRDKLICIGVDRTMPSASVTDAIGFSAEQLQAIRNRDLDQDLLWHVALAQPSGSVFRATDLISDEQFRSPEIYEKFAVPAGIRFLLVAILENTPTFFFNFSLMRGDRDFSDEEKQLLAALTPHLKLVLEISRRVARGDRGQKEALMSFDRAQQPVILLNSSGYALFRNRSVDLLLQGTDAVALRHGRLQFRDVAVQGEFERILRMVLSDSLGELPMSACRMRIPADTKSTPHCSLQLVGLHNSADRALMPAGSACMVLLYDQAAQRPLPLKRLSWLYDLTPAELRICEAIHRESSVDGAAEALHLSRNTVRSHLKTIYAKFGVTSQGQLMQRLANSMRLVDGATE